MDQINAEYELVWSTLIFNITIGYGQLETAGKAGVLSWKSWKKYFCVSITIRQHFPDGQQNLTIFDILVTG